MRAIDTNVLVRLITRDDRRQFAAAERFVEKGAWVSLLALAETAWVLTTVYGRRAGDLGSTVELLLQNPQLSFQDRDVVEAALKAFRARPSRSLSDCLMLEIARKEGRLPLGTFDSRLGKLEGTQRL